VSIQANAKVGRKVRILITRRDNCVNRGLVEGYFFPFICEKHPESCEVDVASARIDDVGGLTGDKARTAVS